MGEIQPNAELTFELSIERIELQYRMWECNAFVVSFAALQTPFPTSSA